MKANVNKVTNFGETESDEFGRILSEHFQGIYSSDELSELREHALMMEQWSHDTCKPKNVGGMEEWAKEEGQQTNDDLCCDWYHGTWQYLRLLNMVAVPRWYPFYQKALSDVLSSNSTADVMISALADYGMLHALDTAIKSVGANPNIIIYDICETPLKSAQWYAERHGLAITCIRDNIITSNIPDGSFDLIVTDEFLSVLRDEYKPLILEKWKKLLRPGGSVVTTAMLGNPTTPDLRKGYFERASKLLDAYAPSLFPVHARDSARMKVLLERFKVFALQHTRHMIRNEAQIRDLFKGFDDVQFARVWTPGECVNPTESFQIIAKKF